jgi:hypothetical protein
MNVDWTQSKQESKTRFMDGSNNISRRMTLSLVDQAAILND